MPLQHPQTLTAGACLSAGSTDGTSSEISSWPRKGEEGSASLLRSSSMFIGMLGRSDAVSIASWMASTPSLIVLNACTLAAI